MKCAGNPASSVSKCRHHWERQDLGEIWAHKCIICGKIENESPRRKPARSAGVSQRLSNVILGRQGMESRRGMSDATE